MYVAKQQRIYHQNKSNRLNLLISPPKTLSDMVMLKMCNVQMPHRTQEHKNRKRGV